MVLLTETQFWSPDLNTALARLNCSRTDLGTALPHTLYKYMEDCLSHQVSICVCFSFSRCCTPVMVILVVLVFTVPRQGNRHERKQVLLAPAAAELNQKQDGRRGSSA